MNPGLRKFLVTTVVVAAATAVMLAVIRNRPAGPAAVQDPPKTAEAAPNESSAPANPIAPIAPATAPTAAAAPATLAGALKARPATPERAVSATRLAQSLGSLDETKHPYRVEFAANAAGVSSIVFSEYWVNVTARNQARNHRTDASVPMPSDDLRYVLATTLPLILGGKSYDVPVLAVHSIEIDGAPVSLFGTVWSEEGPGRFATELFDDDGLTRFRIEREFVLDNNFELALKQSVKNLSSAAATVRWVQYGPGELADDPTSYVDARRLQFGYLMPPDRDPGQDTVVSTGQMFERAAITSQIDAKQFDLWPNADALVGKFTLSWFGSKSRYFCLAVHAPWTEATPTRSMTSAVEHVRVRANGAPPAKSAVLTELHSPARQVAAGATTSFDLGVFAGPLDPNLLGRVEPYAALSMDELIVYMLSSCCTWCTFAWLANGMYAFLAFLHDWVVFDWGLAIIVLVVVVRLALHPLMKRSQIQMQRFGRAMGELKPELDALKNRYPDDPKKMQSEQMRLYREKGVNPVGCVGGILPTFLQMPIWIALYAVLFFNWDLRQSPAFFGIFQQLGGWAFLGDLSLPDNFIPFSTPIDLSFFLLRGVNLLPILMGFVFFFQQKYMTPPQPNMTPEQAQQQKIMKWMMVGMFPLMMYLAPSGLTLYILTSTCIGIWESRMVKRHIDLHGFVTAQSGGKNGAAKKQDTMGRMYESMLERARQKQSDKNKKTYKDRE